MLIFCILSSLIIGLVNLYKLHQIDEAAKAGNEPHYMYDAETAEPIYILSTKTPLRIKLLIVLAFVPFFNLLYLLIILW